MEKESHFFAAMYLRLSRKDNAKDSTETFESNSIHSQKKLIQLFLGRQADIELYDIYLDNGFSGSSFERPAFQRMIRDIEAGRVNCVIVKDLSRFGRDYLQTGIYLEQIFPALGVRFISLSDHYDSFLPDMREWNVVLPIKNFINDSYCRDISIKIKSQLEAKRRAGEFLSSFAVYGYQKNPHNKNQLIPDLYAAEIVRMMFSWKIKGMAVAAIAKKLNDLQILSPREYKKSMNIPYRGGFSGNSTSKWSSQTVKRILTDEVYLGHLVQGKTETIGDRQKKRAVKSKEKWVRTENTHEPIISSDDFKLVQNLLQSKGRESPRTKELDPFTGLLFCRDCQNQMIRRTICCKSGRKEYYICSAKNRGEGCSRHSIEKNILHEILKTILCQYIHDYLNQEIFFAKTQTQEKKKRKQAIDCCFQEIKRMKQEEKKYHSFLTRLAKDASQNVITEEEFLHLQKKLNQKIQHLRTMQDKQEQWIKEIQYLSDLSLKKQEEFLNTFQLNEIDRYALSCLVKRILVCEQKQIEVEFYFCCPHQKGKEG